MKSGTKGIVFVNQWVSHLTKDIVNAVYEKTGNVVLIAGNISSSGTKLHEGVVVRKIVKYNKKSVFSRLTTWLTGAIQVLFIISFRYRRHHLFLSSNPPILPFIQPLLPNSYSVQILDIYPDALVAGGFIGKHSVINKFWEKRNRSYFENATSVFTLTKGMSDTISAYTAREKVKVVNQWPSTSAYQKIEKEENLFIKAHSLEGRFIVMYSGNLGLGHHVDVLVECARMLENDTSISFIIIGEGWYKPKLEEMVEKYNLKNCMLLPFQDTDMFKHSIQSADLGMVSVSKEMAHLMVPIKTYNLINNRIPLLCITEGESELSDLINKYEIGRSFAPDRIKDIVEFISEVKNNSEILESYKSNMEVCSGNYTSRNSEEYVKVLVEAEY